MKIFNQILPTEIISDILSRLPAESVLECKSVCKTWKNLFQHPSFPQMHLNHLNRPDSADSGKLTYVFMNEEDEYDPNKHLYYFEYNENEDWNYVKPIPRKFKLETTACEAYIVIGSFNGLICIYGTKPGFADAHGPAIILNPVTKEYVVLPELDKFPEYETKGKNSIRRCHMACGFGYLASSNEYKVVRIYMIGGEPGFIEAEVYTVGSGKGWRHVGKFGFDFDTHCEHTHGVFLNGCLHWRNPVGRMVMVFDLADEKFREHIAPPPMLTEGVIDLLVLGVSGGGILYYDVSPTFKGRECDDVWLHMKKNDNHVMKEHGGHQSWGWSKVTSLEQREPFCFLENGTILRYDQGNIKWLSSTSTWENFANFSEISRQVFPHKHTFVSLKELGEVDTEIMEYFESGSD